MHRPDPRSLTLAAALAACLVLPGALPGAHAGEGGEPPAESAGPSEVSPAPASNRFT